MNDTLANRLSLELINDAYFNETLAKLYKNYSNKTLGLNLEQDLLDTEITFLVRCAFITSHSTHSKFKNLSLQVVSMLFFLYGKDKIKNDLKHILVQMGNFPGINVLMRNNTDELESCIEQDIYESYKQLINAAPDSEDVFFTDSQLSIFQSLTNNKVFSFSGPTSIGKSFLIKNFIKHILKNSPKENIVTLVPTKALINQYVEDVKKDLSYELKKYGYNVFISSEAKDLKDKNLLLILTPERLIRYVTNKDNPPIGFLFVDEAHKISTTTDVRSLVTFRAIEKTTQQFKGVNIYFASPFISNPEVFLDLFGLNNQKSERIDLNTVTQHFYKVDFTTKTISQSVSESFTEIAKTDNVASDEFELIYKIGKDSNSLIYCHSVSSVFENAKKLYSYLKQRETPNIKPKTKFAIEKIKEFIHNEYFLAEFLELGIAFHYGNLPQVIRLLIEDLYRSGEIKYMFTTSTLLEGVNLPTKNMFILSKKKGISKLEDLDFWNLSGRAGRMNIDLNGNVFYIVKNKEDEMAAPPSKEITVNPTITERIDKNTTKIKKSLEGKDISGTESEKEQIQYVKNMICVDKIINKDENTTYILDKVSNVSKDIIDLAEARVKSIVVPQKILSSNEWIDIDIQNSVFAKLKVSPKILPSTDINYEKCLQVLNDLSSLYDWENTDKKLANSNKLKYYAMLVNQWINGFSLNHIIIESINYNDTNNRDIYKFGKSTGKFNRNNPEHVNELIIGVIDDIESILRFRFERYFNHYHQVMQSILGESYSMPNWAKYLEYGTYNKDIIALQDLGLSRYTAQYINNNHKDAITSTLSGNIALNTTALMQRLDTNSISYLEVSKLIVV